MGSVGGVGMELPRSGDMTLGLGIEAWMKARRWRLHKQKPKLNAN